MVDSVYHAIKQASDECDETECIIYDLGLDQKETECKYRFVQKQAFCDMIFSNCFVEDGNLRFYDQEWVFERIPADFVLYRAFKILYSANAYLDSIYPLNDWLDLYGISARRSIYDRLEEILFSRIQDDVICSIIGQLRNLPENTIADNIALLTNGKHERMTLEQKLSAYMDGYHQRDFDVKTLEAALNQRSTDVATLEAALNQRSTDVATLETALDQKSQEASRLYQDKISLQQIVEAKDNQLREQSETITQLKVRLSKIEATWVYRFVIKVYALWRKIKK